MAGNTQYGNIDCEGNSLSSKFRGATLLTVREDVELLASRDQVYRAAREAKPERWSKQTRNWQRKEAVMLNP